MNRSFSKLMHHASVLIELQLFLTLCSLPFLIGWGMPFSLLTFVGNLVFTPMLTAFLLLSSLIFITELVHIPNTLLISLLELGSRAWNWLLTWGDDRWMIYFCKPPLIVLLIIPFMAGAVLYTRKRLARWQRIGLFLITGSAVWGICSVYKPVSTLSSITCSTGKLTLIYHKGTTVVVDTQSVLSRISAHDNWIRFQLIPALATATGKATIDALVIAKCGLRIFQLTKLLIEKKIVSTVYLPYWSGDLPKKTWRAFFEMKKAADAYGSSIVRYGNRRTTLKLDEDRSRICFNKQELPLTDSNRRVSVLQALYYNQEQATQL